MIPTLHQSASLELTTPLTSCCNCGVRASGVTEVELIDTPLRRTRYFLFFGTELTIIETFPYCKPCRGSAGRARSGWFSKFLSASMLCAVLVFAMTFADSAKFPAWFNNNFFMSVAVVSLLITYAYFQFREANTGKRSYYQPVSLAEIDEGVVTLRLTNWQYAQELAKANSDMMRAGALKIVSTRDGQAETLVK